MRDLNNAPRISPATADYPNGRIMNSTPAQGGQPAVVGTAIVEEIHGDFIQLFQRLIIDAGISPNDLPDNVTNGYQLLSALNAKVLETALSSSMIGRTAFDNVFSKLNTESLSSVVFDNNPGAIIRVGDAQTVIVDLNNVTVPINGIMRDSSVDVPVGTRITITFKNTGSASSLRLVPSGLSGFVFNFDGATTALVMPAGQDSTFTFKFLGVDPDQSNKKVILIESAPGYVFSQVDSKADSSDVIIKGGGDSYTPIAATDPINKGYADTSFGRGATGSLTINNPGTKTIGYNRFLVVNGVLKVSMSYIFHAGGQSDAILGTWPSSLPVAAYEWRWAAASSNTSNSAGNTLYVAAGTRTIRLLQAGDDQVDYSFEAGIPLSL